VEELSEAVLFGVPHLLLPDDSMHTDIEASEVNKQLMAALCQARHALVDHAARVCVCKLRGRR